MHSFNPQRFIHETLVVISNKPARTNAKMSLPHLTTLRLTPIPKRLFVIVNARPIVTSPPHHTHARTHARGPTTLRITDYSPPSPSLASFYPRSQFQNPTSGRQKKQKPALAPIFIPITFFFLFQFIRRIHVMICLAPRRTRLGSLFHFSFRFFGSPLNLFVLGRIDIEVLCIDRCRLGPRAVEQTDGISQEDMRSGPDLDLSIQCPPFDSFILSFTLAWHIGWLSNISREGWLD